MEVNQLEYHFKLLNEDGREKVEKVLNNSLHPLIMGMIKNVQVTDPVKQYNLYLHALLFVLRTISGNKNLQIQAFLKIPHAMDATVYKIQESVLKTLNTVGKKAPQGQINGKKKAVRKVKNPDQKPMIKLERHEMELLRVWINLLSIK